MCRRYEYHLARVDQCEGERISLVVLSIQQGISEWHSTASSGGGVIALIVRRQMGDNWQGLFKENTFCA